MIAIISLVLLDVFALLIVIHSLLLRPVIEKDKLRQGLTNLDEHAGLASAKHCDFLHNELERLALPDKWQGTVVIPLFVSLVGLILKVISGGINETLVHCIIIIEGVIIFLTLQFAKQFQGFRPKNLKYTMLAIGIACILVNAIIKASYREGARGAAKASTEHVATDKTANDHSGTGN